MLKSLPRRRKLLRSWHRSHWLHSKLPSNFYEVNFGHTSNRLPRTKWWSLPKECARQTLVRHLPLSSRSDLLDSTPAKPHNIGAIAIFRFGVATHAETDAHRSSPAM